MPPAPAYCRLLLPTAACCFVGVGVGVVVVVADVFCFVLVCFVRCFVFVLFLRYVMICFVWILVFCSPALVAFFIVSFCSGTRGTEGGDDQGAGGIPRVRAQRREAHREHQAPQGAGRLSSGTPYPNIANIEMHIHI